MKTSILSLLALFVAFITLESKANLSASDLTDSKVRIFVDAEQARNTQVATKGVCLKAFGIRFTPGEGIGWVVVDDLWQCSSTLQNFTSKEACEASCN